MQELTISRAAEAAGVGVETIRFYERRGLIEQPEKSGHSAFRHYSMDVVRRVRFIRKAQEIGFSLREIEELLALRSDPSADCADIRKRAAAKVKEVDSKIAELRNVRAALKKVIDSCPGEGALGGCTILDALQEAEQAGSGKVPAPKIRSRVG